MNLYDEIDTKLHEKNNCDRIFSAMSECITKNLTKKRETLYTSSGEVAPLRFDLTKCDEYKDFVTKNNVNIKNNLTIKYNLFDIKYPPNKNYEIIWNKETKIMIVHPID